MSRHHRHKKRKAKEKEAEEKLRLAQESLQKKDKGFSLTSLFGKVDLKTMSGQLKDIADSMEKFGQIAELLQYADVFVNPKQDGAKGSGFNLMNLLKDGESLNHLMQALAPAFRGESAEEKKVEPINVETHSEEKE
ncbi:hypothetical protein [Candidatus Formimonas warabiya]|uniref:Uncharacterized protein n=1 Tax=Formimonas warabiya TaxID=1761012 RepID=A0A3G1KLU6_FORW1|nr:hypothetical protein [Candidatus Formimonas warabiya]ATW23387.1 hypothetical protein DCMF_00005 [Candidatus Formimonas warabiya]